MTNRELLEAYLSGVDRVEASIEGLGEAVLNYRPDREGAWSIKEHVIHLVDSETNGFVRIKSIIAQPKSEAYVMEEEGWTANIRDKNEDIDKYRALFGLLRSIVYDFVKGESEENWKGNYFVKTYKGETKKVTIADALEMYVLHVEFHLEYVERLKREARERGVGA